MPKIDLYKNVFSRKPEKIEIANFLAIFKSQAVKDTIIAIRSVEDKKVKAELKKKLPAWTPMSTTESTRSVENSKPTGFIMFDYDHLEYNIESTFRNWFSDGRAGLLIAHITPSGKGLRLVFRTEAGQEITKQFIEEQHEKLGLHVFGEYDKACSDYCRLSFITDEASILYLAEEKEWETTGAPTTSASEKKEESSPSASEKILETASPKYSKDEILYKGHKVSEIAEAYVAEKGEPEDGEKHLYYNQLVKNFRNICDNNPEKVASVLPMFGESYTYRLSQCKSICKANSTTYLPKAFYFWLRKKGYLVETAKEENEEDVEDVKDNPPFLPPIFREFVQVAPRDFMLPVINSIMPVLGTLTSFLRADYFDGEEQSTTFSQ